MFTWVERPQRRSSSEADAVAAARRVRVKRGSRAYSGTSSGGMTPSMFRVAERPTQRRSSSEADAVAAAREDTTSLAKMLLTCRSTVLSLSPADRSVGRAPRDESQHLDSRAVTGRFPTGHQAVQYRQVGHRAEALKGGPRRLKLETCPLLVIESTTRARAIRMPVRATSCTTSMLRNRSWPGGVVRVRHRDRHQPARPRRSRDQTQRRASQSRVTGQPAPAHRSRHGR